VSRLARFAARATRPAAVALAGAAACGLTLYLLGWRPPAPPPPPPEPEPVPVTVVRDAGSWYVTAVGTVVSASSASPRQDVFCHVVLRCSDHLVFCHFPIGVTGPAKFAGPVAPGDAIAVQGVFSSTHPPCPDGVPARLYLGDCIVLTRSPGGPPQFQAPGAPPPRQPARHTPVRADS
jgi:hypothetical protein